MAVKFPGTVTPCKVNVEVQCKRFQARSQMEIGECIAYIGKNLPCYREVTETKFELGVIVVNNCHSCVAKFHSIMLMS